MIVTALATSLADRYRIERELGAGGMATVYLAHDLKHDRDVAIKVVHPDLGSVLGGERFLAEIKLTAKLQHPHILPLLDSGEAGGLLYYVMPLVTGETLRARLERERQLPIEDALRIAREVADALGYAHGLGIVHRDIKPENILLQGGHALVADFGIALAVQEAGGHRMTQTGLSLGTPQYMAPEQAMGDKSVGARADIYALGAVTYEMLTGEPPFTGATVQAIVAKVLTEKPASPSAVRETVPPGVEAAVMKALAKLPADRWISAERFAEALTQTDTSGVRHDAATSRRAAPRPWRTRALIAASVAGALLLAGATYEMGRRAAHPDARWTDFTQLTDASGVETEPSMSPDGESFAYASHARGSWDIYVQRVGGRNPLLVAGDSTLDERWPAYSPDGKQIAYALNDSRGIFVVGATGESARRLTAWGSNPAWSPDGKRIVFGTEEVESPYRVQASGTLWTVDVSGGEPRRLEAPDLADAFQPAWSPSGARIAFWTSSGGQRDLETIPAAGGERLKVTNDAALDWAPVWSPDGRYLYFASDRGGAMGIWRIAVDESSGRVRGAPEPVASGVDVAMDLPHLSRDGTALLFRSKIESSNPAAIAFDPTTGRAGAVTLLQHRTGMLSPSDVSPDGKWIALNNSAERRQDIFLMRADGSALTRVTDDDARDWRPRFTPDGSRLLFYSNRSGKYDAWSMRLDGSDRTRLTDLPGNVRSPMFSPDGREIIASRLPGGTVIGGPPWPVTEKTARIVPGLDIGDVRVWPNTWSHDGRWLAGPLLTATNDDRGIGIYDRATHTARELTRDAEGLTMAFLPGDRQLVYVDRHGSLMLQDIGTLARREIIHALPLPHDRDGSITMAPDGRTIYYAAHQIESNIWLVKQAPGTP